MRPDYPCVHEGAGSEPVTTSLPVAVQLVGRPFAEDVLLRLGVAIEGGRAGGR